MKCQLLLFLEQRVLFQSFMYLIVSRRKLVGATTALSVCLNSTLLFLIGDLMILLVSFQDSSIVSLNLASNQVVGFVPKESSPLLNAFVVTERGSPISLPAVRWRPPPETTTTDITQSQQVIQQPEDKNQVQSASPTEPMSTSTALAQTAPLNQSDEPKATTSPSAPRSPSTASLKRQATTIKSSVIEKFLVVCCVNSITIYKLPSFQKVQRIDCPSPVSWFSIARTLKDSQGPHILRATSHHHLTVLQRNAAYSQLIKAHTWRHIACYPFNHWLKRRYSTYVRVDLTASS